jgi:hypothetical protein
MVMVMSKLNSDALHKRWADPAYRARQTEANRRQAEERRKHFADPRARKRLGLAVKAARRKRSG